MLKKDAVFTDTITVSNNLTLVSNNQIMNYSNITTDTGTNSIVKIDGATEDVSVYMNGVTLSCESGKQFSRGLTVGANTGKVTIVLDNVNINSAYYALNISGSSRNGVEVVIRNSTLSGWAALNVWSQSNITLENCTIIGTAESDETYATIVLNKSNTTTGAAGSNVTFKNCTIEANNVTEGSGMKMLGVEVDASVTFDGCTFKVNGNTVAEPTTYIEADGSNATIIVK